MRIPSSGLKSLKYQFNCVQCSPWSKDQIKQEEVDFYIFIICFYVCKVSVCGEPLAMNGMMCEISYVAVTSIKYNISLKTITCFLKCKHKCCFVSFKQWKTVLPWYTALHKWFSNTIGWYVRLGYKNHQLNLLIKLSNLHLHLLSETRTVFSQGRITGDTFPYDTSTL